MSVDAPIWDDSPAGLARWILALPPSERARCRIVLQVIANEQDMRVMLPVRVTPTLPGRVWFRTVYRPDVFTYVSYGFLIDNLHRELPVHKIDRDVQAGGMMWLDYPVFDPWIVDGKAVFPPAEFWP